VETSPITAELNVPRSILSCLSPRRVNCAVNPLDIDGGIKRFRESIIEAAPGAADGLADPQPAQDAGELGRSIIAAMPLS